MTLEEITVATAERYLKKNKDNRTVRDKNVEYLATEMEEGRWVPGSGNPIKFDTKGHMFSGQHRCLAVIRSKKTIQEWVLRGASPKARMIDDVNSPKHAGDILRGLGFSHANIIAAVTRVVLGIEAYQEGVTKNLSPIGGNVKTPNAVVHAFVKVNDEDLQRAVDVAYLADRQELGILTPTSTFVGVAYCLLKRNGKRAEQFFEEVIRGVDLSADSAAYKLRKLLIKRKGQRREGAKGAGLASGYKAKIWLAALTIKAWNAWLYGDPVKSLRWQESEAFPKISARPRPHRRKGKKN